MIKRIQRLKKRLGGIKYITYGQPQTLAPEAGDMAWTENESGCCFGIRVEKIGTDGSLVGTVASIRPVGRVEVDGVRRHDRVRIAQDFVWQVVRAWQSQATS